MKWFGPDWGAPICKSAEHTHTPIGTQCGYCDEPLRATDRGLLLRLLGGPTTEIAYHLQCFLRSILG